MMLSPLKRLTTERSAVLILFLLVFAMASRISVDTDLWWHLRSGQTIATTGQLIYPDPFSHTFTDVVHLNHSALSDLVLYEIWRQFNYAGVTVATAIVAVAGMSFVFLASRASTYPRAFLVVLAAATASVFWSPRPQMFSFLLATILLWILRDLKYSGRDRLWWILPLLLFWCNTHGGFVIGYLVIGAFAIGEFLNSFLAPGEGCLPLSSIRKLALLTVASLPLLALNPLGIRVYSVPFSTIAIGELRQYIQEWQSPDFSQPQTWSFILLLALVLASLSLSKRKFDWTEWILVCGSAVMGLLAARNIALFAIVAAPVVADHVEEILQGRQWTIPQRDFETPKRVLANLCLIILVSGGVALYLRHLLSNENIRTALMSRLPVAAVKQLDSLDPQGNMFNSYNWGGYIMFHAPQYPVFIDGRSDLYRTFLNDYYQIATAAGDWRQAFEDWRIGFAVIETQSRLAQALSSAQDWRKVYQDPLASIFARRSAVSNG